MTKHTPLPWNFEDETYIRDANGQTVATFEPEQFPQDLANAAYIVRAVNAHQELLAACKAAKKYLALDDAGPELDAQLSQAIAKAEGK